MSTTLLRRALAALAPLALVTAGCGPGASTAAPTTAVTAPAATTPAATTPAATGPAAVNVTLQEWAVVPGVFTVPAGAITFEVTNKGPDDVHEFVIIKTDLDAGALPVDATGAVTEGGAGLTVVDEIEDIPVGQTQELVATLEAGTYVLICNIYDPDEKEAHYEKGMRVAFDVTG